MAGLTAAWLLGRKHDVQLFEKNDYVGGHTRTLRVPGGVDAGMPVDTGFIVFNYANYPRMAQLFKSLNVPVIKSDMSFGASLKNGKIDLILL